MRKILILLALSVLIQTTVSQDFRIGEEDLFRPEIYAKYIKNVTLVRCSECRGPGIGDLDVFDVGEISCLMSARDECVNSSHVLEYYCVNTSSVDSQSSECPVNYSCSGGKCMYLPDLTIHNITVSANSPRILRLATVKLWVLNIGYANSSEANLTIYWGCDPLTAIVEPLPVGGATEVVFRNSIIFEDAGRYNLDAVVDSESVVDEYDEGNNNLHRQHQQNLQLGCRASEI